MIHSVVASLQTVSSVAAGLLIASLWRSLARLPPTLLFSGRKDPPQVFPTNSVAGSVASSNRDPAAHSITSSARARIVGGIVIPMA